MFFQNEIKFSPCPASVDFTGVLGLVWNLYKFYSYAPLRIEKIALSSLLTEQNCIARLL
jgi:hypothetical protein